MPTKIDFKRLDMRWRQGECACGASDDRYGVYDSRGIYLAIGCKTCLPDKLKGYRADVLYGPPYEAGEPIEPEEY